MADRGIRNLAQRDHEEPCASGFTVRLKGCSTVRASTAAPRSTEHHGLMAASNVNTRLVTARRYPQRHPLGEGGRTQRLGGRRRVALCDNEGRATLIGAPSLASNGCGASGSL